MHKYSDVLRYAAFATEPTGGNPAGVALAAEGLTDEQMQTIATDVGYSETAFVTGLVQHDEAIPVRYFSPEGEVPFCGHATIATAAAIAEHVAPGAYQLRTRSGIVRIQAGDKANTHVGSLDSPATGAREFEQGQLNDLLEAVGWSRDDLHADYQPSIGTAGNLHPVLVARSPGVLASLDYDFSTLQELCRTYAWITVQLIAPLGPGRWRSRNPFPYGGVVEDPATGSAAAAFTGFLRERGAAGTGDAFTIHQGVEMGRPSRIDVRLLEDRARVSGPAVPIG